MGCWNETCMVSNMPIFYGDEIVMLILTRPHFYHDGMQNGRDVDSYWRLCCTPMFGKYDSYGGIEDVQENNSFRLAIKHLKKNLVPRGQGENKSHDHEVKPEETSIELLNKWFHGNRCLQKDKHTNKEHPVIKAYVKKDVWDYLVSKDIDTWHGIINKKSVKEKLFEIIKPKNVIDDYDEWLDNVTDKQRKMIINMQKEAAISSAKLDLGLYYIETKDLIEENFNLMSEITMFINNLDVLRKCLGPTVGAGSQSVNLSEMMEFCNFVHDKCIEAKNKFEE